jgi:hypothetical protein
MLAASFGRNSKGSSRSVQVFDPLSTLAASCPAKKIPESQTPSGASFLQQRCSNRLRVSIRLQVSKHFSDTPLPNGGLLQQRNSNLQKKV